MQPKETLEKSLLYFSYSGPVLEPINIDQTLRAVAKCAERTLAPSEKKINAD